MTDTQAPSPGWYPDPAGGNDLRFWDGAQWTDRTRERSRPDTPADPQPTDPGTPALEGVAAAPLIDREIQPSKASQVSRRRRRRKDGSNAIVGVLLVLFAVVGMYEIVTGESSTNSNPNRFAVDTTTTPTTLPVAAAAAATPGGCSPGDRLLAFHLISSIKGSGLPLIVDLPASPLKTTTATGVAPAGPAAASTATTTPDPSGQCTSVSFTDRRGSGVNHLVLYGTVTEASRASDTLTSGRAAAAVGRVVVDLAPTLKPLLPSYASAIAKQPLAAPARTH
jgi:hypothetical protein